MPGEDFILLPNGKKIYIKETYGKIGTDDFSSNKMKVLVDIFDIQIQDGKLNPSEIGSIFSSLKSFANQDGNNELSSAELMGFIRENVPSNLVKYISQKDMMKFLEAVQEKSDKALKAAESAFVHIENTVDKIFPELSFLNLGLDNDIDMNKFTFDEIKKHYPEDKYEINEVTEKQYVAEFPDGRTSVTTDEVEFDDPYYADTIKTYDRTFTTNKIINKETGLEVVSASGIDGTLFNITITNETDGKEFTILKSEDNTATILTSNDDGLVNRTINIKNGKVNYAYDDDNMYYFDNGVIEKVQTNDRSITYTNGVPDNIPENNPDEEPKVITQKLLEIFSGGNIDCEKFAELINKSIDINNIGACMDEYYALTGRELTDDIRGSNLPDDTKTKLLNDICEPYVDSKYYDASKKIENSKIDNKYYTSEDEYSIQYNGPIIMVYNKTSGETTRINLKSLMKDMDYRKKSWLERSLQTIQSFPGEVLENMSIELSQILTMKREERNDGLVKFNAAAFYEADTIHTPRLDRHKGSIIVHEMAHGIDEISGADNPGFMSARSKFKEVYDKCIAQYEANGHKRFDEMHPNRSIPILPINNGVNYATYTEQEAFAICVEILMGYKDSNTRFITKVMPELIDAARDLYLEIRKMPRDIRRRA